MKCEVEDNEIVLRVSTEVIKNWVEFNYNSKIISDDFFNELAERIIDDQDMSEDFCINRFLDERIELLLESSENALLEDEEDC